MSSTAVATAVAVLRGHDSTVIGEIPGDTQVVVCYSDRAFKNDTQVRERFPELVKLGRVVALAAASEPVDSPNAGDGVDTEPGNLPPQAAAASIKARIAAGHWRPVGYADLSDMHNLISDLHLIGVPTPPPGPDRPWRVYTAHPTGIEHLCGPHTCGQLQVDADATQWWWSSLQNPGGPDLDKDLWRYDALPHQSPIPVPEDTVALAVIQNQDGRLAVFVELADGEVKHKEQEAKNGGWWPKWLSLGNPTQAGQ